MSLSEQLIEHGEPLLAVDATFAVMRVNRAWETLTGIARSEAVGRSLWSLYETESPEGARWRRGIERCLALRVTGVFERANGPNIGWTSARVQPLENGLALYFKDISTERRSELEREELAAQRQLALDAAKMGWWTYDPVKQHATADARFAEIFGLETPAIDMPTWQSLVHPDDFPAALKALTSSVEHPDHPDYITQYRIRPPGGLEKWVEAHGIAVFTAGASPSAQLVVGTARDITERKRSEQALAAALEAEETERRRLQAVLQALPAGVLITDAEGRPLQANDAFRRIWGAPPMTGNRHDYGEWKGYR
ncbi:MAG TPA: PAS domain S-box protein, partial [Archangium sp.]